MSAADYECPICLEVYCLEKGDARYPHRICEDAHYACLACVRGLRQKGNGTCPVCRGPLLDATPADRMVRNLLEEKMALNDVKPAPSTPVPDEPPREETEAVRAAADHFWFIPRSALGAQPLFPMLGAFQQSLDMRPQVAEQQQRWVQDLDHARRHLEEQRRDRERLDAFLRDQAELVAQEQRVEAARLRAEAHRQQAEAQANAARLQVDVARLRAEADVQRAEANQQHASLVVDQLGALCDRCTDLYVDYLGEDDPGTEKRHQYASRMCGPCQTIFAAESAPAPAPAPVAPSIVWIPSVVMPPVAPRAAPAVSAAPPTVNVGRFGAREGRAIAEKMAKEFNVPLDVVTEDIRHARKTAIGDPRPAWCSVMEPCQCCREYVARTSALPCNKRPQWLRERDSLAQNSDAARYLARAKELKAKVEPIFGMALLDLTGATSVSPPGQSDLRAIQRCLEYKSALNDASIPRDFAQGLAMLDEIEQRGEYLRGVLANRLNQTGICRFVTEDLVGEMRIVEAGPDPKRPRT
jgi:hypothetical protein